MKIFPIIFAEKVVRIALCVLQVIPFCVLAVLLVVAFTGCFSHQFPKDAYIRGAHSKIVTPWGTSEIVIDEAATGMAARNASLPDVAPTKSTAKSAPVRQLSDVQPASAGGVK